MRINVDPSTDPSAYSFTHDIRVRFAETDAMGIVHHASCLPYLEESRVAYLRSIDHDYVSVREAGLNFAVIEVALKYVRPCYFDDVVTVRLRLGTRTKATFQIEYLLTVGAETRLTAVTAHGCIDHQGRPLRLPAWLADL
ncbi:MAG: thioesterase family protein [Acidimicrobiales bacterium]